MRFMKVLLIVLLCYLGLFGVACLIGFYITGNEPATLITAIFGSAGVELLISGAIKVLEKKVKTKGSQQNDENPDDIDEN